MFKHLSMLFDDQELPSLLNRYEELRINGDSVEVAALRNNIVRILKSEGKRSFLEKSY